MCNKFSISLFDPQVNTFLNRLYVPERVNVDATKKDIIVLLNIDATKKNIIVLLYSGEFSVNLIS